MSKRPNILLITTDQQRLDTLGCYGAGYVRTPNLDRLAQQGTRFNRAYTVNPVCMPTRVSIFTGVLPSRHGVWNIGVNYRGEKMALSDDLLAAGYRTHYVGKAHFETMGGEPHTSRETLWAWPNRYPAFRGPYFGFETIELALGHTTFGMGGHYGAWVMENFSKEEFKSFEKAKPVTEESFGADARDWGLPTRFHNSVWTADRTIDFLEKRDASRPFFLAVGFQDPHHPHALPTDFPDRVDPATVPLPDFTPGELDDKPPHFLANHFGKLETSWARGDYPLAGQWENPNYSLVSENAARWARAYYYSMVQLIDREMGRILNTLDRLNLTDDTIVIFTTDHGDMLGDHGMWMKGAFLYEQLLRVPLIVRWPGQSAPGASTDALYSHIDLAPTLLAAAGVTPSTRMDGVDFRPLLTGEKSSVRNHVIVECVDDPRTLRSKAVITADRKLVWYCGQEFGELYDLKNDPHEKINHWSDPAYAHDKTSLLGRILASTEPLEFRSPRHCYA